MRTGEREARLQITSGVTGPVSVGGAAGGDAVQAGEWPPCSCQAITESHGCPEVAPSGRGATVAISARCVCTQSAMTCHECVAYVMTCVV